MVKFSKIWYVDLSQQRKCYKKTFFWIPAFFGRFSTKKQPKNSQKNNFPKFKPFDEIFWNLECRCFPTTKNATKKLFLEFGLFWPFFNQKTAKKNLKKCQNPNHLMKFSEIWYVDASKQQKMLRKNFFWISTFFGRFLTKKQPKNSQNKKIGKIQTVWWNFLKFGM